MICLALVAGGTSLPTALTITEHSLHVLFERRLRESGASYVLPFQLWDGGRHMYTLFFATNGVKGCEVMKQAMWSVDSTGSYAFKGALHGQGTLDFSVEPSGLEDDLRRHFGTGWITMTEADSFMMGDQTLFLRQHLRTKTLVPLERKGIIEVQRPSDARRGTFGDGVRFRFRESTAFVEPSQPSTLIIGDGTSAEVLVNHGRLQNRVDGRNLEPRHGLH